MKCSATCGGTVNRPPFTPIISSSYRKNDGWELVLAAFAAISFVLLWNADHILPRSEGPMPEIKLSVKETKKGEKENATTRKPIKHP